MISNIYHLYIIAYIVGVICYSGQNCFVSICHLWFLIGLSCVKTFMTENLYVREYMSLSNRCVVSETDSMIHNGYRDGRN